MFRVLLSACLMSATVALALPADAGAVAREAGFPLQQWMIGNATPAMSREEYDRLEKVFQRIGAMAPSERGFEAWPAVSRAGAAAAARHDIEGARHACKDCHDNMRAEYKRTLRMRPLPR